MNNRQVQPRFNIAASFPARRWFVTLHLDLALTLHLDLALTLHLDLALTLRFGPASRR